MVFKINGTEWIIEDVDDGAMKLEAENDYTLGLTIYKQQKILLVRQANIIKTLKHELAHVWMYEYGHNQHNMEYSCEDVCEIVASINDFINEIVRQYLEKQEKQKVADE